MSHVFHWSSLRVAIAFLTCWASTSWAEMPAPPPQASRPAQREQVSSEELECPDGAADCGAAVEGDVVVPNVNVGAGGSPAHPVAPPAGGGAAHPAAPAGGGGGGNLNGEAVLALLVAAAVVLPFIVYAVDSPAPPEVLGRWSDTHEQAQVWGGAVWLPGTGARETVVGLRGRITHGWIGVDASFESALNFAHYGLADVHLLLQPPPRTHLEGALAIGPQWLSLDGTVQTALEIALPHRYVFVRDGPRQLGFDLRPAVVFHSKGVDVRLDAGFTIPLFSVLSLQLGGRAYSLEGNLGYAATGGLFGSF